MNFNSNRSLFWKSIINLKIVFHLKYETFDFYFNNKIFELLFSIICVNDLVQMENKCKEWYFNEK